MRNTRGFTIIELLIVIIVIAILAAITIVAYNGVQQRAQQTKISSDLRNLNIAIQSSRTIQSKTLSSITGNAWTAGNCITKPSGTDLASLSKTDMCWTDYLTSLDQISTASGTNVRGLQDPWGRPYFIDENEGLSNGGTGPCLQDLISVYNRPFVTNINAPGGNSQIWVPYSIANC